MLESVREIHGHASGSHAAQRQSEKLTKNRDGGSYLETTNLRDKVARVYCVSVCHGPKSLVDSVSLSR